MTEDITQTVRHTQNSVSTDKLIITLHVK